MSSFFIKETGLEDDILSTSDSASMRTLAFCVLIQYSSYKIWKDSMSIYLNKKVSATLLQATRRVLLRSVPLDFILYEASLTLVSPFHVCQYLSIIMIMFSPEACFQKRFPLLSLSIVPSIPFYLPQISYFPLIWMLLSRDDTVMDEWLFHCCRKKLLLSIIM